MIITLVLQQLPGPPPTATGGMNELLWQQQALQAYNEMLKRGYIQLAAEWKAFYPTFHQQHPQYSVQQVLSIMVGQTLSGGIGSVVQQTGGALGQIPGAAAAGAEHAIDVLKNPLELLKYPADFFHALTQASTWIRVAEFAVGAMLIYVGIKAVLTPGQQQTLRSGKRASAGVTRTARKVVTRVTPTGRAAAVITRHETRVKAQQTRQRATVIRGKQREFGRRELYR